MTLTHAALLILATILSVVLLATCVTYAATSPCRDGSRTLSHAPGRCSHHGGVER